MRWVVFVLYPLAGAVALGWGGAWRGIGRALVEAGVERGFVDYVADGLLDQGDPNPPEASFGGEYETIALEGTAAACAPRLPEGRSG